MKHDIIKRFVRIRGSELLQNPKNWREHTPIQGEALEGIIDEVGIAVPLVAYETPDGVMLIDGHLRVERYPDRMWPVVIVDVGQVGADKLLATIDPLAELATGNPDKIQDLLMDMETDNGGLQVLLDGLMAQVVDFDPIEIQEELAQKEEQLATCPKCEHEFNI
jgi:hypothetical protein